MAVLNKTTLFERRIVKKVELANGDAVHIAPLPAREIMGGEAVSMEKLIHRSLCDEKGEPFFTESDDAGRMLTLPLPDFNRLSRAILDLNGMKATDNETGQAEKN